jgi:hypothetical protein
VSTSPKSSLVVDTPSKVKVSLYGHGNIRSFKNSKQLIPARKGKPPLLITHPEIKKQMEGIIRDLLSLFVSASQTNARETSTGCSPLSLIASYLPEDDSRQWIPVQTVTDADCEKGHEGVDITIQRL